MGAVHKQSLCVNTVPCLAGHRNENGFPGYAVHEKGLQRQKGAGPLVRSPEKREAAVLLINRSSTARCVPPSGLHRISFVRASEESSGRVVLGTLGARRAVFAPVHRPAAVPSRRAAPRPAPPAPLCPARPTAVRRPTSPRPWYVQALESTGTGTIRRRSSGQRPGRKRPVSPTFNRS